MSALNTFTIAEARDKLRAKEVTAVELTQACLTAIEGADALGAYVHKTPDLAMEQAKAADARLAAGDAPDMCGIPLGIKDLFCTKGVDSRAAFCKGSSLNMKARSAKICWMRARLRWAS